MSDPAVMAAVRKHLEDIAGLPEIIWPNEARRGVSAPFLTFDFGTTSATTRTPSGRETFDLRPAITLYEKSSKFTADGDVILWAIAQGFKLNTKIYDGATEVARSLQTPVSDNGFHEDGLFRRTMTLRLASYQTV